MADETIELGDIRIAVFRKAVKHTHLAVHPPDGHVTLVAPPDVRSDVARAYAITRLPWIREQRARFLAQPREPERRYVERESHYLWGDRYLLRVEEADAKPTVRLAPKHITLTVRPGADRDARARVMQTWYTGLLRAAVRPLLAEYAPRLGVAVPRCHLRRMHTKWGSCNPAAHSIRLNTELAKKPRHLLAYVVVHELAHLLAPHHGPAFVALLDEHYPTWATAREELNRLPVAG